MEDNKNKLDDSMLDGVSGGTEVHGKCAASEIKVTAKKTLEETQKENTKKYSDEINNMLCPGMSEQMNREI